MNNLEIAQAAQLLPIAEVAKSVGIQPHQFDQYGPFMGKLTSEAVESLSKVQRGKLILVSAMSPTPAGEGKTTTTIGLTQGLQKLGHIAVSATREPALGPIFGMKGGACGGGYSQVLPMEEINLFFTGDFPAVAAAHNLLSAMLDNHLFQGNELEIDVDSISWPRTLDMNDRALRSILIHNGKQERSSGFVIAPASEIMAILCMSPDLISLQANLNNIVVARNKEGKPITARQLKATGAMAILLKNAIRPNLVQTIENGLALVHGGPFGNIAHGCSSLAATKVGLGIADFVLTEGGFGSDLGGEKFLNIVCPRQGFGPNAIVLVVTIRAIRHHGGDSGSLESGFENVARHFRHLSSYHVPVLVVLNKRADDPLEDIEWLADTCRTHGMPFELADPWSGGGQGCLEAAKALAKACQSSSALEISEERSQESEPLQGGKEGFRPLYTEGDGFEEKLQVLCEKVYQADGFELSESAENTLRWLKSAGYGDLPICIAKTQYSFSDDPALLSAPTGFIIHVRELRLSAGAGFIVVVCGPILLMPGLGKHPSAETMGINSDGTVFGLF